MQKRPILNLILVIVLIVAILPAVVIPIVTSNQVAWAAPTVVSYSTPGTVNWTVPARVSTVTVLVIGGGGGSGGSYSGIGKTWWCGGGGGGGGYQYNTSYPVTSGTNISVTVGGGGTGGVSGSVTAKGTNGSNSVFGVLTAIGGGAGGGAGSTSSQTTRNGENGGSGGGEGVQDSSTSAPGTGSQGYDGGSSWYCSACAKGAGGGGGNTSAGGTATSSTGGAGGTGTSNSISGSSVVYSSGGGGAGEVGGSASGGGGAGGSSADGNPGTDGTGGGGGGGGGTWLTSRAGADGGDGTVIISYTQYPEAPTNVAATDGTYTDKVTITWTKSTGATGYYVYNNSTVIATLGDVATYDDSAAGAPTITAGTASATDGTFTAYVTLSIAGETGNNGASRTYKVVAFNVGGNSSDSSTNAGYRGTTTLTYQWSRSAADSDASYSTISGGTTDPYNDTGAPSNGAGRYFKCNVSMSGATSNTTLADRGYRNVTLSISNTPASKAFSFVLESTSYWSNGSAPSFPLTDAQCFFTVTNDGSSAETISVNVSSFTGGVGWTITTGSPGSNTVRIKTGKSGDANEAAMVTLTGASAQTFISALATSGTKKWEIKLETGTFTDGVLKTGTVVLTATTD